MVSDEQQTPPSEVTYRFTHSIHSRKIPVDGIWGGVTSTGNISVALFTDTLSNPNSVTYAVDEDSQIGAVISMEIENVIEREVQVEFVLNLDVARVVRDWLGDRIEEAEKAQRPME